MNPRHPAVARPGAGGGPAAPQMTPQQVRQLKQQPPPGQAAKGMREAGSMRGAPPSPTAPRLNGGVKDFHPPSQAAPRPTSAAYTDPYSVPTGPPIKASGPPPPAEAPRPHLGGSFKSSGAPPQAPRLSRAGTHAHMHVQSGAVPAAPHTHKSHEPPPAERTVPQPGRLQRMGTERGRPAPPASDVQYFQPAPTVSTAQPSPSPHSSQPQQAAQSPYSSHLHAPTSTALVLATDGDSDEDDDDDDEDVTSFHGARHTSVAKPPSSSADVPAVPARPVPVVPPVASSDDDDEFQAIVSPTPVPLNSAAASTSMPTLRPLTSASYVSRPVSAVTSKLTGRQRLMSDPPAAAVPVARARTPPRTPTRSPSLTRKLSADRMHPSGSPLPDNARLVPGTRGRLAEVTPTRGRQAHVLEACRSVSPRLLAFSPRQKRANVKHIVDLNDFRPNLEEARKGTDEVFGKKINTKPTHTFRSKVKRGCEWLEEKKEKGEEAGDGRVKTYDASAKKMMPTRLGNEMRPVESSLKVKEPAKKSHYFASKTPRAAVFKDVEPDHIVVGRNPKKPLPHQAR
eukprot:TRINITY_DN3288_c0_g2_i1.p1 TRINITY_DN3288_c0_g2~~TRINITY_DN3288_c0_g2_i1.p1  ORF type:complete len:567 (+),score=136.06 TRINITY_DN3288_c0_g2_i1:69-1769(+)